MRATREPRPTSAIQSALRWDVRRPPGPVGRPLLGILPEFAKDPLGVLHEGSKQYGDVIYVRLGTMGSYLFNHPDMNEEILRTRQSIFIKDKITRLLSFTLGDGLLTSEGAHWRKQRKLCAPALKKRQIAGYADTMTRCAHACLEEIPEGEGRDIYRDMSRMTLDVVGNTLFGSSVDSGKGREVGEIIEVLMMEFIHDARSWRRLLPPWVPTQGRVKSRKATGRLDEVIYGLIREARGREENRGGLLNILLEATHEDGTRMSDHEVRDEAVTIFVAGHETTALALSYTLYEVARSREIAGKLREEVDGVLRGRVATFEDVEKLEYTRAVVLESMRLYPPAWIVGREPLEDVEIGGYLVPKGAQCLISQWLMHRDPRWFEDPEVFRPERWLDGLQSKLPRFVYFPFGGGARTCIGNHFAMMNAILGLAACVQRIEVSPSPGFELSLIPAITLRPVQGVRLNVKRRK